MRKTVPAEITPPKKFAPTPVTACGPVITRAFVRALVPLTAAALCALSGCASKTVTLDPGGSVPDTPHCEFMKDACNEAMEFQKRFDVMTGEEKDDAKAIMNAYVQQCQDAQEMCRRSAGQK